jgi:hypothetical protein
MHVTKYTPCALNSDASSRCLNILYYRYDISFPHFELERHIVLAIFFFSVETRPIPILPNLAPTLIIPIRDIRRRRPVPPVTRRISSYKRAREAPRDDIATYIRNVMNRDAAISGPGTECVVRHIHSSEAQCERLVKPGSVDGHDDVCGNGDVRFGVEAEVWC